MMNYKAKTQLKKKVLKWVNEEREKKGLPKRTRLLKGNRRSSSSCPVARSLGNSTWVSIRFWGWNTRERKYIPFYVAQLIRMFDKREIPELIK